jgi:hypothetical protein
MTSFLLLIALVLALYAFIALRPVHKVADTPDPAFLASFATPPAPTGEFFTSAPVLEAVAPAPVVFAHKPVTLSDKQIDRKRRQVINRALAGALREAGLTHYIVDASLWTRCQTLANARIADAGGDVVTGIEHAVAGIVGINAAAKASKPSITLPVAMPNENENANAHKPNSTERMRALRAARKNAGLTARGTQPMNACAALTRKGTACKNKSCNSYLSVCATHLRMESAQQD